MSPPHGDRSLHQRTHKGRTSRAPLSRDDNRSYCHAGTGQPGRGAAIATIDRASVQSSLAWHLGFAADQRRASAAEAGAAELMADLYCNHAAPLDDQTLFAWHAMLMNGRRDIAEVGRYRMHEDAMQIVSGALHAPRDFGGVQPGRSRRSAL